MIQRILTLSRYHLVVLFTSLTGLFYFLLALAYHQIFFAPGQRTPDADYLIFIMGIFGAILTFLVTLSVAGKANEANGYIFFVRLASRVEYLVAVLLSSISFAMFIQLVLTILAIVLGKSELTLLEAVQIPPIWLSLNILMGVVALHASDFASAGWSRTVLFGSLLLLLFMQGGGSGLSQWLGERASSLSGWFYRRQLLVPGEWFQRGANWLYGKGDSTFSQLLEALFWPFQALSDGVVGGSFQRSQALAPLILLLYATLLFLLASDLIAGKDLYLSEA